MALTVSVPELVASSSNPLLGAKAHWSRVRLGAVATVLNGAPFKSELFAREGGVPLIRIRDVGKASSETRYLGDFEERYLVHAGDLLVGMDGEFNCARWRGEPGLLNQRVCKVTVDPSVYEPRFLDCVLPGYLRAINEATSSVTVKHLSSRSIEDIPLPSPTLEEQRALADEIEMQFSRLDEALAELRRAGRNLRSFRQATLHDTFAAVRGGGKRSLDDVCEVVAGYAFQSRDFVGTGIPVVKIANVGYGQFEWKDQEYLSAEFGQRHRSLAVRPGDLLFALTRPITNDTVKVCQYPAGAPVALLNQRVAVLRLDTDEDARYVLSWMSSPQFKSLVLGSVSQTLQPNLSPVDLRRFSLCWPAASERCRIVAEVDRRLSIVREVEAQVDANLKRAQALRAVLAKAFGGPINTPEMA